MTIPLFPEGGLASSVITTVWVGVFVLCFFNLRFGWVLSGLVVPGYLVPLIIVKPLAAAVIVAEAILSFALVWLFSEKLGRGRWPALFGRDRFMGLILASIAVRLTLDGFVLPDLADWLAGHGYRQLDWQSDLQSFGLVIVSLLANQFWKPGLARGLFAMVVTVGLTWAIVRFGLMEFTNFRISGVSYLYEGLASSILASPKAYIILVLTAMYASHMNVRYGWDFSGILIPALIALQWYQPIKILTSFLEAGVIYGIAVLVLRLPMLANTTIEGGRKLLLFFNISFAYKLLLGHAIVLLGISVKTTDTYGFGYLLATLIAVKAHDKQIFPRLMRTTLQVSLMGAVAGNVFGLIVSSALPLSEAAHARSPAIGMMAAERADRQWIVAATGDAYLRRWQGGAMPLSSDGRDTLGDLVRLLESGLPPVEANARASASGWRVASLAGNVIAIARADGSGGDVLLFYPSSRNAVAVHAIDPAGTPGLALAADRLRSSQDARWLTLTAPLSPQAIGQSGVLDVFDGASRLPRIAIGASARAAHSAAHLAGSAAADIDVHSLRKAIPGLALDFDTRNLGSDSASSVTQIALAPADLDRLAAGERHSPALAACGYRAPLAGAKPLTSMARLAFLRGEVAEPVMRSLSGGRLPATSRRAAEWLGLALEPCRGGGTDRHWQLRSVSRDAGYALFAPSASPARIVHGFSGFAKQARGHTVVITPAPGAVRAALALGKSWDAGVALLAPSEEAYGRSQLTGFGVLNQVALRQLSDRNGEILQLRTVPATATVAVTPRQAKVLPGLISQTDPLGTTAVAAMTATGFETELIGRGRTSAGIEAEPQNSLRYLNQSQNKVYAVVMLSREAMAQ